MQKKPPFPQPLSSIRQHCDCVLILIVVQLGHFFPLPFLHHFLRFSLENQTGSLGRFQNRHYIPPTSIRNLSYLYIVSGIETNQTNMFTKNTYIAVIVTNLLFCFVKDFPPPSSPSSIIQAKKQKYVKWDQYSRVSSLIKVSFIFRPRACCSLLFFTIHYDDYHFLYIPQQAFWWLFFFGLVMMNRWCILSSSLLEARRQEGECVKKYSSAHLTSISLQMARILFFVFSCTLSFVFVDDRVIVTWRKDLMFFLYFLLIPFEVPSWLCVCVCVFVCLRDDDLQS